jgi:hypothetical protein
MLTEENWKPFKREGKTRRLKLSEWSIKVGAWNSLYSNASPYAN